MPGSVAAWAYAASAEDQAMPNLFSFLPVEILSCPPAVTSGLTRKAMGAVLFMDSATALSNSNSARLSTLKTRISAFSAASISSRVLPTPEKTILWPGIPAKRARASSPPLTTSAPAPILARVAKTAMLELALTE